VLSALKEAEKENDNDGLYAFTSSFYEDGIKWHEEIWSRRLCHSVLENVVDQTKLEIVYTARCGNAIQYNVMDLQI